MNPSMISAMAAIGGSLVGAFGSATAAWIAQSRADRRRLLATEMTYREQLYSDFINESAKAIFDAAQHALLEPHRLVPVYALLSRIRLSSATKVIESAEEVMTTVLKTYAEPNLTAEEIQARAAKRQDPLRKFSDICRTDLESLWTSL